MPEHRAHFGRTVNSSIRLVQFEKSLYKLFPHSLQLFELAYQDIKASFVLYTTYISNAGSDGDEDEIIDTNWKY